MCDVVFITPNMRDIIVSEAMGTLQLASILKENNISCKIVPFYQIGDLSDFDTFIKNAIKILDESKPKIVSFYTRCDVYHIDLMLARVIKDKWPDMYIVCGGPQSDITSVQTIEQISFIDYICCGEGEKTIYPFFSSLLAGKPDLTVPGLVYLSNGVAVKNPRPVLMENLDELPMLDYSFLYLDDKKIQKSRFPIEVGRGCPFGCTFCTTNSFWGRKYRLKSPQRIYEEIKTINECYGVTKFKFTHDMFTLNRKDVIETCRLLKTLDFNVDWGGSSRVDCIDKEMIDIMVDAGLSALFLGIETGSERMQKVINKNLKLERAAELIEYMISKGVRPTVSFMYGFPDETEEDLSQTIALLGNLIKQKNIGISLHLCAFFVGTEMSAQYADQMTPVDYYSNVTGDYAVEECKDIILTYPDLFTHMLEYKTELRQKLKYFDIFISTWMLMQPVYQYLSKKYPANRLVDMYYDFSKANFEIFEKNEGMTCNELVQKVVWDDKFIELFKADENYDLISDFYRLQRLANSNEVMNGGTQMDMICFDANCIKDCSDISDFRRGSYIVVYRKGKVVSFPKKTI